MHFDCHIAWAMLNTADPTCHTDDLLLFGPQLISYAIGPALTCQVSRLLRSSLIRWHLCRLGNNFPFPGVEHQLLLGSRYEAITQSQVLTRGATAVQHRVVAAHVHGYEGCHRRNSNVVATL